MFISDMNDEDLEISIKVVIVGNGAVGKSSLIQRYCRGTFTKGYKKTIGVDFLEKQLRISGEDVRLMLWDTAGQEEFDAITKAYYRGAQACVVAFSTIDRPSFEAVKKWKNKVEEECGGTGSLPMVLVQNKIDLMHQSAVSPEEVERLAKEFNMRVYRTSVKEDINVGNVFQHLAENYVHKVRLEQDMVRFDASGSAPRSICIQGHGVGNRLSQRSSGPNDVDGSCNGSTSSSSSNSSRLSGNSVASSGYFSLTDFGPVTNFGHGRIGRSVSTSSAGSVHLSPQDYLNNPMFDSLNNHRNRLHWPSSSNGSGDRTISLKPLGFLTNKKKSSTSSLQSFRFQTHQHHNPHYFHGLPPPKKSSNSLSSCKVL